MAFAQFVCDELSLDIPIGASKLGQLKLSSGGVHHQLLKRYGRRLEARAEQSGLAVVEKVIRDYPQIELFVIGSVTSVGQYCSQRQTPLRRATMQGGFVSYKLYAPAQRLPNFEGKDWVPTFNLNGDRKGADSFLAAPIGERRFVSKNVCHTLLYDRTVFERTAKPQSRAAELFVEGMAAYLEQHDHKKWHDPTAAVLHLFPHIGTWLRGRPTRIQGGWGTQLDPQGDYVLADVNREQLWDKVTNWGQADSQVGEP